MPKFGNVGHEKDISFHLFCSSIAAEMKKVHHSQHKVIFNKYAKHAVYDVDEMRAKIKFYLGIKV